MKTWSPKPKAGRIAILEIHEVWPHMHIVSDIQRKLSITKPHNVAAREERWGISPARWGGSAWGHPLLWGSYMARCVAVWPNSIRACFVVGVRRLFLLPVDR